MTRCRLLCIAGLLLCLAADAGAQCRTLDEADALKKFIKKSNKCNNNAFVKTPGSVCAPDPAPGCAGTLGADSVALSFGVNNPPLSAVNTTALAPQLACQDQIGKSMMKYFWKKYDLMIRLGMTAPDADEKAAKQLNKIPDVCSVTVAQDAGGVVVPAVGPQCAAAAGPPGSVVNGPALRDCLHTLAQVWFDTRYGSTAPQPLRPNIVLILTDDQRWDTIDSKHSPFGTDIMPLVKSELGGSGVEFSNGFMTTPLCCPSRASILTGLYAHNTGVRGNAPPRGGAVAFNDSSAVGLWLQAAGYRTGFYGKYLNGYDNLWDTTAGDAPYVPPGWNEWHGMKNVAYYDYTIVENGVEVPYGSAESDYSTDVLRDKALGFIHTSAGLGQPFFLYFAPKAPHGPWIPAVRHTGMFSTAVPWRPPSYNEADVSDKPLWVQNTPLLTQQDQTDLDAIRIAQLEMLQAVDEAVKAIMDALRAENIADNTFVVYIADNGWTWGEHRRQGKNHPYEEAIRTALFLRYPKLAPLARSEDRFALNIDLAPTFAELAGASIPLTPDGVSLIRLMDGTAPSWRSDFMTEGYPANHTWASIRDSEWKYTEYPDGQAELYDLNADPFELTNVAFDPANADCVAAMAARIRQIRPNWPNDTDPGGELPDLLD